LYYNCLYFFFFFFQAEDGIRDRTVTGVQTCALPILRRAYGFRIPDAIQLATCLYQKVDLFITNDRRLKTYKEIPIILLSESKKRSEERRVGKECRYRRWRDQ